MKILMRRHPIRGLCLVILLALTLQTKAQAQNKGSALKLTDQPNQVALKNPKSTAKSLAGAAYLGATPLAVYWVYTKDIKNFKQFAKELEVAGASVAEISAARTTYFRHQKFGRYFKKAIPFISTGLIAGVLINDFMFGSDSKRVKNDKDLVNFDLAVVEETSKVKDFESTKQSIFRPKSYMKPVIK